MLAFGGVVTAVPLIAFAYGVRRIPLSLVGVLQYVTPTLQLLLGVWFFHEPFDPARALGFVAIWLGLLLYLSEGVWQSRRSASVRLRPPRSGLKPLLQEQQMRLQERLKPRPEAHRPPGNPSRHHTAKTEVRLR